MIKDKNYYCDGCGRMMYSNEDHELIGGPPFVIPYSYKEGEYCWSCLPVDGKKNPIKLEWRTDARLQ